jgi:hypothetical protein
VSLGFRLFLIAHLASVIVGYGAVVFDTLLARRAARFSGPEALAVAQAGYAASVHGAQLALYLVLPTGIGAVLTHPDAVDLATPWVSAAFVVFFAGLGALHGIVGPARRRAMLALGELAGRGDDGAEAGRALAESGRRLQAGHALFHVLGAVALWLMVFQPGG